MLVKAYYREKRWVCALSTSELEESFVDFSDKFCMSAAVLIGVVVIVNAGPVFQNLGEFGKVVTFVFEGVEGAKMLISMMSVKNSRFFHG